jgi:hypothetical protein
MVKLSALKGVCRQYRLRVRYRLQVLEYATVLGSRRRRGDTGCPPGRCSAGASGASRIRRSLGHGLRGLRPARPAFQRLVLRRRHEFLLEFAWGGRQPGSAIAISVRAGATEREGRTQPPD